MGIILSKIVTPVISNANIT